jgi:hypothetical protein
MARRWRAALCLLAACATAAAQEAEHSSSSSSSGEACAWSGSDARPCDADASGAASQALHALRRELDTAAARIAAERAALDEAAARVRALRASLAGCGDADADAAEDSPPPPLPPPLLSPPVQLRPPAGGAADAGSAAVALVPALLGGGAGALSGGAGWAHHRLTVAARPPPGWGSLLPLLSALRVLPPAHASALLTLPPEPLGAAPPRFIAVGGADTHTHARMRQTCVCARSRLISALCPASCPLPDSLGRVYVFTPAGALVAEAQASGGVGGAEQAVTALCAAPLRRNATAIVAGHADGTLSFLLAEEGPPPPAGDADSDSVPSMTLTTVRRARVAEDADASNGHNEGGAASPLRGVTLLEALPFAVGRLVVAADGRGGIGLFSVDGSLVTPPASSPRAVRAARASGAVGGGGGGARRVLFVSDAGIGTLDVPAPPPARYAAGVAAAAAAATAAGGAPRLPPAALRAVDCTGLNGTRIAAARFDAASVAKVWAVTTSGELLQLHASFAGAVPSCSVRSRRALPPSEPNTQAPPPPFSLTALPGYVIASSGRDVWVLNTSAAPPLSRRAPASRAAKVVTAPPRLVLTQRRALLAAPFADAAAAEVGSAQLQSGDDAHAAPADGRGALLAAAPRGGLLLLSLGDGLVGVFENALAPRGAKHSAGGGGGSGGNAFSPRDVWSQPLFVAAAVLLAVWQFNRASGAGGRVGGFGAAGGGGGGRQRFGSGAGGADDAIDFGAYARAGGGAAGGMAGGRRAAAPAGVGGAGGDAELSRALRAFDAFAGGSGAGGGGGGGGGGARRPL